MHIVSLDVPLPANYGGAIDIFYRIKALHKLGVKIHLHCFEYGRGQHKELNAYCENVFYYKRKKRLVDLVGKRPFIVKSRISETLLKNLLRDNHPILFEGLHTCWYLENPKIQKRITMVRAHNIEHEYYFGLMQNTSRIKKLYFQLEHRKLERYEYILQKASTILPIRTGDLAHFQRINPNSFVLPASLPEFSVNPSENTGNYCLFHGNLSVPENHQAACWILENVWDDTRKISLKIAGKSPGLELQALAKLKNIQLIADPSNEEMEQLLQGAKIHLLYTNQATGLKLKLLAALQTRGVIIANNEMLDGSDLDSWCEIANSPQDFKDKLTLFETKNGDSETIENRIHFIQREFDTMRNCQSLIDFILSKRRGN